jgi:hypothetical protein
LDEPQSHDFTTSAGNLHSHFGGAWLAWDFNPLASIVQRCLAGFSLLLLLNTLVAARLIDALKGASQSGASQKKVSCSGVCQQD